MRVSFPRPKLEAQEILQPGLGSGLGFRGDGMALVMIDKPTRRGVPRRLFDGRQMTIGQTNLTGRGLRQVQWSESSWGQV